MDDMEEKRMAKQTDFDPKVHGVGTVAIEEPGSVKELFQYVKKRMDRMESIMMDAMISNSKQGPKGDKGDKGDTGPMGPEGPSGKSSGAFGKAKDE